MESATVERQPQEARKGSIPTKDLDKKAMYVDNLAYHIEMKENGDSRFIRIVEDPENKTHTRVVVPMCVVQEFIKRLQSAEEFCRTYTPCNVSERKAQNGRPQSAHTATYNTPGFRRYYFDVMDRNNSVVLQVSYVLGRRREVVAVKPQAIPKLVEVLNYYNEKFPSISATDDYPVARDHMKSRRTFNSFNNRGFSGGFQRRRGGFSRGRGNFNGNHTSVPRDQSSETVDPRRNNALKIVSDPAPIEIASNTKKFTVEIVEGVNTFFRITEMINDNRKSTLHVPIEICSQLHGVLSDMNKKYAQKSNTNSVSTSKA